MLIDNQSVSILRPHCSFEIAVLAPWHDDKLQATAVVDEPLKDRCSVTQAVDMGHTATTDVYRLQVGPYGANQPVQVFQRHVGPPDLKVQVYVHCTTHT